jgi:hypothetical protein
MFKLLLLYNFITDYKIIYFSSIIDDLEYARTASYVHTVNTVKYI